MPDLNANDLEAAQAAGRWARPVRWASRSASNQPPGRTGTTSPGGREHEGAIMAKGKRYEDAAKRFDREQFYPPNEAVGLAKDLSSAKFDETIELAVRLGVDPRKADQIVRGTVALPAGTGKDVRVAVFAAGEAAAEARAAGADLVGADDLAAEIEKGDARLRRRDRDARPHADGRQARPGARSPWPHAEPQDRHGHQRRGPGGQRVQGRQGRVPHRPPRQRARAARQGELPDRVAAHELRRRARRAAAGQARLGQGQVPEARSRSRRRWGPASRSTPRTPDPRTPRPLPEREG